MTLSFLKNNGTGTFFFLQTAPKEWTAFKLSLPFAAISAMRGLLCIQFSLPFWLDRTSHADHWRFPLFDRCQFVWPRKMKKTVTKFTDPSTVTLRCLAISSNLPLPPPPPPFNSPKMNFPTSKNGTYEIFSFEWLILLQWRKRINPSFNFALEFQSIISNV